MFCHVVEVFFASEFSVKITLFVLHPDVTVVDVPYTVVNETAVVCFHVT